MDWSNDKESKAGLDLVHRRMRENPVYRERVMEIFRRFRYGKVESEGSSLSYLDRTLKSPRLRAVLEEAKQDRERRKAANAG